MAKRRKPPTARSIRLSREHREWSHAVRRRDKYTCRKCDRKPSRTKSVQAHHIESFARCVARRFDVDNGITLCLRCHREVHRLKLHLSPESTPEYFRNNSNTEQ